MWIQGIVDVIRVEGAFRELVHASGRRWCTVVVRHEGTRGWTKIVDGFITDCRHIALDRIIVRTDMAINSMDRDVIQCRRVCSAVLGAWGGYRKDGIVGCSECIIEQVVVVSCSRRHGRRLKDVIMWQGRWRARR